MDILGIGKGVEAAANTYFLATGRTGKTARLVEALRSGDRVVCRGHDEARCFARMLRHKGIDGIEVVGVPPDKPYMLIERWPPSRGRTFFDDVWLQEYYLQEIKAAERSLERLTGEPESNENAGLHARVAEDLRKASPGHAVPPFPHLK